MKRGNAVVLDKWRSLLAEFESSGLTGREFCRKQGLVFHQFKYWKQKHQDDSIAPVERAFAPAPGQLNVRSNVVVTLNDQMARNLRGRHNTVRRTPDAIAM